MGVASLVLGIIGVVFAIMPWTFWLALPLTIVAVILGALGRKSAATNNQPTGKATAGLVLGVVGLVIAIVWFAMCTLAVRGTRKAIETQLNDPNLNQEFNKAFEKALQESQKQQNK